MEIACMAVLIFIGLASVIGLIINWVTGEEII